MSNCSKVGTVVSFLDWKRNRKENDFQAKSKGEMKNGRFFLIFFN